VELSRSNPGWLGDFVSGGLRVLRHVGWQLPWTGGSVSESLGMTGFWR